MTAAVISGLALQCTLEGIVIRTLYNRIDPPVSILPGIPFSELIYPGDREKVSEALAGLLNSSTFLMNLFNFIAGSSLTPLYWSGSRISGDLILVGTPDRDDLHILFQAVIDNKSGDIAEIERDVLQRVQAREKKRIEDWQVYQKFSGLNNQLLNTQRELAKTAQKLRESRDTYQVTLACITDIVVTTDLYGTVVFVSNAFRSITGMNPDTFLHKSARTILSLFHDPETDEPVQCSTEEILNGSLPRLFFPDVLFRHQNGSYLIIELQIAPIITDGEIVGTIITGHDVTEEKNLIEALSGINKRMNLLTSITRHDILNALTAASLLAEMIEQADIDEKTRKYITNQKEALTMIGNLITFTRMYEEVGVSSATWQPLASLIKKAIASLHFDTISVTILMDDVEVYADPMLGKVFYNLLENALRHGGSLTSIGGGYRMDGADLILYIQDNGTGVPDIYKEAIFNREYYSHTGFGLYLSREILTITGLSIRECGTPGQGARFEIRVPKGKWRRIGQ